MKVLSIIFIVFGVIIFNMEKTPKYAYIQSAQWDIPRSYSTQWDIPHSSSQWDIPTTTSYKKHSAKKPPQEVINYVRTLEAKHGIEAAAMLAACYHERGIKNWYDDFLCGFGAINSRPDTWNKSRFGGWQKQLRLFAKRAARCGYFRKGVSITSYHAQMFAKNCYKTEAWQNYGRIAGYVKYFKGFI